MRNYRYILEKGSKKHPCLECKQKRFVRYIDTKSGDYLPDIYGKCDREAKCNYHASPYKDGYSKGLCEKERGENSGTWKPVKIVFKKQPAPEPIISFIPFDILKATRQGWGQNIFLQNLLHRIHFPMDNKGIERVIALYQLGTVCKGYRSGAITFPFIDKNGNIRAIQVKQFDKTNHTQTTDFLHSILKRHYESTRQPLPGWLATYLQNDGFVTCYFGEHLLNRYPANPVALVEAPKTAIIGTLYFGFPDNPANFLWLATYNLSSLSVEKCRALKGRDVYLFPDLNAFDTWQKRAKEISVTMKDTRFKVSDLLERRATEADRKSSLDLADYLTRFDWRQFRQLESNKPQTELVQSLPPVLSWPKVTRFDTDQKRRTEDWNLNITELENHFALCTLPAGPIVFNECMTVNDFTRFIHSHLATVKANTGNKTFLPFLDRLKTLKLLFENNKYDAP